MSLQFDTLETAHFPPPHDLQGAVIHTEIRSRRLAKGITQVRLAALVGIGQPALVNWEHGRFAPEKLAVRERLETILGAPIDVLLENENGGIPKDAA